MMTSPSPDAVRGLWASLARDAGCIGVFLGDCYFHTVEALVAVERVEGIDPMPLFVLRAFEFAQPTDVERLDEVLHLGRQVTAQLLRSLIAEGLVAEPSPDYHLTDQGLGTLRTGRLVKHVHLRRLFHFLHPGRQYIAVRDPKGNLLSDLTPSRAPAPWEFDPDALRETVSRPLGWKQRHGFPPDVAAVVTEPLSPNVPEGMPTAAHDATASGMATAPQHLIVDKAQVVSCTLVVRGNGSDAVELAAYPVSKHGSLVRGKDQPLFVLRDLSDVEQAFPELWAKPTPEQVAESWLALALLNTLPEPERAGVRFDDGRFVVALDASLLDGWGTFATLAVQDLLRWHVPHGPWLRLCPVEVEGRDAATAERLQTLQGILLLEQDPKRAEIVRHAESLQAWMNDQNLPFRSSPRQLADMAFRFGCYRLAYEIGELEDMNDAPV